MPLLEEFNMIPTDPNYLDEKFTSHPYTISADELVGVLTELKSAYNANIYLSKYEDSIKKTTQSYWLEYESIVTPAHFRDNIRYINPVDYTPQFFTGIVEEIRKFTARLNFFSDAIEIVNIIPVQFLRSTDSTKTIIFEQLEA